MPDGNSGAGAPANGGAPAEGGNSTTENNAGNGTGGDNTNGGTGNGDGTGDGGAGDGTDDFKDDGVEPGSRKTAKDYIIERKNRQIAKAKAGNGGNNAHAGDGTGGGDGDDTEDDINPEDAEVIEKVLDKRLAPIEAERQAAQDRNEVAAFVAENPEFKKYEAKVLRYMKHPSRAHLPASSIFYEVAGPDLMKLGAQRQQAAARKANETKSGGNASGREISDGKKSVKDMNSAEFEEYKNSVRRR